MELDFAWLTNHAKRVLSERDFQLLLKDDPRHHAPDWHTFGVLGHMRAVIEAAKRLKEATGLDIVRLAVLHDIGKVEQFKMVARAVSINREASFVRYYHGHEGLSARHAENLGLGASDCTIIKIHAWAYNTVSIEKIWQRLGRDHSARRKWMLLCAADGIGKGFTPKQKEQRRQIAQKFRNLAAYSSLTGGKTFDPMLSIACNAVENWEPV